MRVPAIPRLMVLAVLVPLALLGACSDDDSTGPDGDGLVGTWVATSFSVPGFGDLIAAGMSLRLTLNSSDTYSVTITNDVAGLCDDGTSCTETGTYTSTNTSITLDPGTEDEATLNYVIQGSTMTWTGDIDDIPVTVRFTRD